MKDPFDSTNWIGYAAAVVLIAISFATAFLAGGPAVPQRSGELPPIAEVDIKPGFVGQQSFGLWTLVCENLKQAAAPADGDDSPKRVCRTSARLTVRGPNNTALVAAGFNILMLDTKTAPAILFRLPPSAAAAGTADFAVDKNTPFTAPLRCTPRECLLQAALPPEAVEQLKTGRTLSVVYTVNDVQKQPKRVRVDQLLHGYRQSYDAMTRAISA